MTTKGQYLKHHPDFTTGMNAYNLEGDKLGTVMYLEDDYLVIEKGFFFPKDYSFRYDDIVETKDNSLIINQHRGDLQEWRDEKYRGWEEYDRLNKEGEASIPVHEEQLEVKKTSIPTGEVRIRKVVNTEMKNFTVPVSKEEVIVEKREIPQSESKKTGETAFREEEISIPLSEEKVEITKKPVTKEEIRIKKDTRIEEQQFKEEMRKEDIDIEKNKPGKKAA